MKYIRRNDRQGLPQKFKKKINFFKKKKKEREEEEFDVQTEMQERIFEYRLMLLLIF